MLKPVANISGSTTNAPGADVGTGQQRADPLVVGRFVFPGDVELAGDDLHVHYPTMVFSPRTSRPTPSAIVSRSSAPYATRR